MSRQLTTEHVKIEVNKYVHPVYCLPVAVKPETLTEWQQTRENHSIVTKGLKELDELIVKLFLGQD